MMCRLHVLRPIDARYSPLMAALGTAVPAADAAGTRRFSFRGREADPFAAPERITVAQAFARYANIDLPAASPP